MTAEDIIQNNKAENTALLQTNDKCDKFDYLAAVICGAIGGLIDVFLVGMPDDSILGKWTDAQVDKAVMGFAKLNGWNPHQSQQDNISSAIGFLERKFHVNYDQRYTADVGNQFNMSTKAHHMMSLAHSPSPIGLFFSILNKFTSTATFVADGQLITIATETFELHGGNFIAKIFCGFTNWLGHLMSDIAGSSGSRGNGGRGSGIVIPFYELFSFCKFGNFKVGDARQDLADIAKGAFEEGLDFRFGIAMTIPVVMTDLSIRLVWAIRRHFHYGRSIGECIPTQKHADLRVMLLIGNGTLCVMDGLDAVIRGDIHRLNLIAWFRLIILVLKEIFIRLGIKDALQSQIDAFKRINAALAGYLRELEALDIERFREETEQYNSMMAALENIHTEKELNVVLLNMFDKLGIEKPYKGSFDAFMQNKNERLEFK